jgi:hypothetical protein
VTAPALRTALAAGLGVALLTAPAGAQEGRPLGEPAGDAAACGARLLEDPAVDWLTDTPVVGDFTLDGPTDAAVWGVLEGGLVVRVARCDGPEPTEQWLFPVAIDGQCDASAVTVRAASMTLDAAVVDRVCAPDEGRDECVHLRRENERRRALDDAGAREIRIEAPGCGAVALVWSPRLDGFTKLPR